MYFIIAIDPGASGGVAVSAFGKTVCHPMPDTEGDRLELIRSTKTAADIEGADCLCVLEEVNGFVGKAQPGSAMFKFGEGYGFLKGVVQALGIKLVLVRPQVWQKCFGLGTAASCASKTEWKNKLKAEAQRRFPDLNVILKTADALLILEWVRAGGSKPGGSEPDGPSLRNRSASRTGNHGSRGLSPHHAHHVKQFGWGCVSSASNQQSKQSNNSNNRMKIKTNSGNFQPCPEYTGSAVCVDVTPLKTVQTQFGPKEKFRFVFEIGESKDDGTPWCVWSAPFTPSYHENSALRPFLRKWMGRELTGAETATFDTEDLLGRAAHITVIHEHGEGEIYANIALIQPDKSATPLKPSGKFVRMKDRQTGSGLNGAGQAAPAGHQGGYRRSEQPVADCADLGATKIHVGKCKGLEVRDLSPEQVGALIANWLPTAKANPKPLADDKRLMAALESWQAAQAAKAVTAANDDDVPY